MSRSEWKRYFASQRPASSAFGAGVDQFASEVDAAFEQGAASGEALREVALSHRGVGASDEQALRFALAQDVDPMLEPAAAAGQHDRGVGRLRVRRRGLAKREGEQDKADRVNSKRRAAMRLIIRSRAVPRARRFGQPTSPARSRRTAAGAK